MREQDRGQGDPTGIELVVGFCWLNKFVVCNRGLAGFRFLSKYLYLAIEAQAGACWSCPEAAKPSGESGM